MNENFRKFQQDDRRNFEFEIYSAGSLMISVAEVSFGKISFYTHYMKRGEYFWKDGLKL